MAGGCGLNLTVANIIFVMDIWWNPAVEEQVYDRVHRIGQTKEVQIHRFLIGNDSIEMRIKELQIKKMQMINGILGKDSIKGFRLSKQDLINLLQDD